jgi:hypothetical protein
VTLLAGCVTPAGAVPDRTARDGTVAGDDRSPARCGREDTPETGIQGDVPLADQQSGRAAQGYNCGLALVGHDDLGGQGGGDMAWSGDCAYVRSGAGIKVVDVSDPAAPVVVETLPITISSENIHAVTTRHRALLVAAGIGPNGNGRAPVPVTVWDVRDCTDPRQLGTVDFPGANVHNIELTPDATRIYGSLPLQVADITDLGDPSTWTVRDFQCEVAAQAEPGFTGILFVPFALDRPQCAHQLAHEFEFNPAGTRTYIGGQISGEFATQQDPQHRPWHTEQELRVVDISVWPPTVVSTVPGAGHGIRRATIRGRDFLLHSNENVNPDVSTANGCIPDTALPVAGAAQAFLTDISDERAPRTVSELELAINDPAHCADQQASGVKSTVHWNDVDDPDRTRFAMLPMGNAGLRIFDVRRPEAPTEVAYFNPGQLRLANGSAVLDRAANHTRYVTRSVRCGGRGGHGAEAEASAGTGGRRRCQASYIWLTTRAGGFWVLEIEPQVRRVLDLPQHRAVPTGPSRQ